MTDPKTYHDQRLSPVERKQMSNLPPAERQRLIETLLVRYPHYRAVSKFVAGFHHPVVGGTHDRGHVGALLGATRSGKSWVLRDYAARFPARDGERAVESPVIYVEIHNDMAAHDVAVAFFEALGYVSVPNIKTRALMKNIIAVLPDHKVELAILDDLDNALRSKQRGYASTILGFIKGILDKDCCNILCAGRAALYDTLAAAEQIKGRGGLPQKTLQPYRWQVAAERDQIRLLLDEIDERLPFARKSGLADPDLAGHFYHVSGGLIGLIMNYIRPAAYAAINAKADRLERSHLVEAARKLMPPGARFVPFHDQLDLARLADDAAEQEARDREDRTLGATKDPFSKKRRKAA